jgi:hypothetical protein
MPVERHPPARLGMRRCLRSGVLTLALALTLAAIAGSAAGDTPAAANRQAATLPTGAVSTTSNPKYLAVTPSVAGLTRTVRVQYVADGDDGEGGDTVFVAGPSGTRCAGNSVIVGSVSGPDNGGGPVTIYMGPNAAEDYPWSANEADTFAPEVPLSETLLARWCPGWYTGQIWCEGPTPAILRATFSFDVVRRGHDNEPGPRVATHLRAVTVAPLRGSSRTTFAVRYGADDAGWDRGDVVQLEGPTRSACHGRVLSATSGRAVGQTKGPATLHIGPSAGHNSRWAQQQVAFEPSSATATGAPLRRWCPGAYKGTILYENGPKFTVIARFALDLAR